MAIVYPFPVDLYHPFMLWRLFILFLLIFIIHSCYRSSLSFLFGSLSSIRVISTVYPFPMALYHPFMLCRRFILSLWLFIIHSYIAAVYPFPLALYHPFVLWRQFILSLWPFIISFVSSSFLISFSTTLCTYLSFHNVSLPFLYLLYHSPCFYHYLFIIPLLYASYLSIMYLIIPSSSFILQQRRLDFFTKNFFLKKTTH